MRLLKEVVMPEGHEDVDELVRAGCEISAPRVIDESPEEKKISPLEQLRGMCVTHNLEQMKGVINNSVFIFEKMLMTGVISEWYAWPNGGKTLLFMYLLREAVRAGRIDAANVLYINADDNYEGLYYKGLICKEMGVTMISPEQNDTKPHEVIRLIVDMAKTGEAEGRFVVLDTLKKFTDMMNKKSQSDLFAALRVFTSKGGTVHLNGHANKHLDTEGRLVYEGTSDTKNDIDIQYAIYNMSEREDERQVVEFRCEKDRGKIAMKVAFEYQKGHDMSYTDMLDSVRPLDEAESARAKKERRTEALRNEFESVLEFVTALLREKGEMIETDIIAARKDGAIDTAGEISETELRKGLTNLDGIAWTIRRDRTRNNAKVYSLTGANAGLYQRGKNGE